LGKHRRDIRFGKLNEKTAKSQMMTFAYISNSYSFYAGGHLFDSVVYSVAVLQGPIENGTPLSVPSESNDLKKVG